MTESLKCSNHPIAPAIGSCLQCSTPLCGMCSSFSGSDIFCETCFEHHENAQSVQVRTAQFEEIEANSQEPELELEDLTGATESKLNWNYVRGAIVSICLIVIAYQLYSYNQPIRVERDPVMVVRERTVQNAAECLTIFAEIGALLISGESVSDSMICKDSLLNNRVTERDGIIKISHPNPQTYGYSEISVTSQNPVPVVAPLQ